MKKQNRLVQGSSALAVVIGACCVLLGAVQAVGADESARNEVVVLATGGTIAGASADKSAVTGYTSGVVGADALVQAVPELSRIANIRSRQVFQTGSENLTLDQVFALADAVREELAKPSVRGVVVTHGTDTMEESAYLLNLVLDTEKPVVFVGAMRPATAYGADGPANLLNAVRVAASPKTAGLGVLMMMNDTIHCPRFAVKLNTVHVDAFVAGESAAIGSVTGGKVFVNMKPVLRHTSTSAFKGLKKTGELPRVEVLYCYGGIRAQPILDMHTAGAKGIVLACVGDGSMSAAMRPVVKELCAKGFPIVRSSRTGTGVIVRNGEVNDDEYGTIPSLSLNPAKARVLLTLCLMKNMSLSAITEAFETH